MGLDTVTSEIVDVGASITPLYATTLAAVSGTVTLTGYFLDKYGVQIGGLVTYSVTTTPTTMFGLASGVFPANGNGANAVGFTGVASGALYVGAGNMLGTLNAAGGTQAAKIITAATNASPIAVTCVGHGLATGQIVTITGALGNTALNGTRAVTVTGTDTFTVAVAGNGTYIANSAVIAGYIQAGQNPAAGYATYPAGNIVFGRDLPVPLNGTTALSAGTANIGGVTPVPRVDAANRLSSDISPGAGAAVVTRVSKNTAGQIMSCSVSNVNALVRYLQLYDSATSGGAGTLIFEFPIPAGTAASPSVQVYDNAFFGLNGFYCATGIAWGISTTKGSYVAATPADHNFNLVFI